MNLRRHAPLLLAALAAAGAAGAGAGAQPAAALTEAYYTATFDGTVHAVWDEPKHMTYRDCYRSWMHQGHGDETWHVWSTGTNKVHVINNGVATQFEYGTFEYTEDTPPQGLIGKGTRVRTRSESTTFEAGSCGTLQPPMMDPPPPTDCGTRMIKYLIELNPQGMKLTPDVTMHDNPIREKLDYDNCGLNTVESWVAGTWPAATGRLMSKGKPVRSFFGKQDTLTASGKWSDSGRKELQWGGVMTGSVSITWKLTLKRVKPTAGAKPKKRGRR